MVAFQILSSLDQYLSLNSIQAHVATQRMQLRQKFILFLHLNCHIILLWPGLGPASACLSTSCKLDCTDSSLPAPSPVRQEKCTSGSARNLSGLLLVPLPARLLRNSISGDFDAEDSHCCAADGVPAEATTGSLAASLLRLEAAPDSGGDWAC